MPPHYSPTFPNLPPHSTNTPFPPCHFPLLIHLSHLPSSLLSYLFQLTSLPTANRHLQSSNFLSLGRQGKHVWLIVRQPLTKAGWWDAPLALWDLTKAISTPLNLQTAQDHSLFRQSLPYILVFREHRPPLLPPPPKKISDFQQTPKILKSVILNPILSFTIN